MYMYALINLQIVLVYKFIDLQQNKTHKHLNTVSIIILSDIQTLLFNALTKGALVVLVVKYYLHTQYCIYVK